MYKITIANGANSKIKYYETKESFDHWYKRHTKHYYRRNVKAFKLVRGKWKLL